MAQIRRLRMLHHWIVRSACLALVFLALNRIELDDSKEGLFELMMDVSGKGKAKAAIAATFKRLHVGKGPRK